MSTTRSLSISEAAFVSGLKDRELNRVIDERLIPKQLIIQAKSGRRFSTLGVAFAKFYFGLAPIKVCAVRNIRMDSFVGLQFLRFTTNRFEMLYLIRPEIKYGWEPKKMAYSLLIPKTLLLLKRKIPY